MRELEQVFRDGLTGLADEVDATPAVVRDVVARARTGAARRRRSALTAVVAAAAVAVLVTGLGIVLRGGSGPGPAPSTATSSVGAPEVPRGDRRELWHDVSLYVPMTWGWGASPTATARGDVVRCGTGVVQADGRRVEADLPYVGRPIRQPGACDADWMLERPRAPYVWLDGDVPLGTLDLGGGWVRETVQVEGVKVSVASDDAALRRAILGSVHRISGGCAPHMLNPPAPRGTTSPAFVPTSMTVCAYLSTSTHLDYDLAYGEELSMGAAKALVAAVDRAAPMGSSSCFSASGGEWALLRLRGEGGASRDYVVDMECPSIADPSGTQHVLNAETVTPWAVDGVNAVLQRHPSVDVPDRFIPPLP